jgi:hypothetical protein
MSNLAQLSILYPTVPMRLQKDRPDNDRTNMPTERPEAGTVLPPKQLTSAAPPAATIWNRSGARKGKQHSFLNQGDNYKA